MFGSDSVHSLQICIVGVALKCPSNLLTGGLRGRLIIQSVLSIYSHDYILLFCFAFAFSSFVSL